MKKITYLILGLILLATVVGAVSYQIEVSKDTDAYIKEKATLEGKEPAQVLGEEITSYIDLKERSIKKAELNRLVDLCMQDNKMNDCITALKTII